jgi:hypothetical protein
MIAKPTGPAMCLGIRESQMNPIRIALKVPIIDAPTMAFRVASRNGVLATAEVSQWLTAATNG